MMPPTTTPAMVRERFLEAWLARTIATYPDQTGRLLRAEADRFRNPVGHALRTALADLSEELFGGFDPARVAAALDVIVRIRAVQEFSPAAALGFVDLARDALREAAGEAAVAGPVAARIDELAGRATGTLDRCRQQIRDIQARAERRQHFVAERMAARAARASLRQAGQDLRGTPS